MGSIMKRGRKFYLRYIDTDGTERTRLARGATTKEQAKPLLSEIERRIQRGELGVPEPTPEEKAKKTITVAELFARFNAEYTTPKIKKISDYRAEALSNYSVRIDPMLGKRAAASVHLTDVEALRDKLTTPEEEGGGGYAGNSVVLTLALLSKMYTWGRKVKLIDCDNPARGCDRPNVNASIDYLDKQEVANLLEHTEISAPDVYPMVATAIYTGMRKGELFGLRWRDVHLDRLKIDVMRSYDTLPKSGKARHLPMHPALAPILRTWRDRCPKTDDGLVFPVDSVMGSNYDMLGIADLIKAAGCHVPAKPFHALRDTFASHFIMNGGNVITLQRLLGHATIQQTMKYVHLAPDFMTAEVARITFTTPVAGVSDMGEARRQRELENGTGAVPEVSGSRMNHPTEVVNY
jgi:integrase